MEDILQATPPSSLASLPGSIAALLLTLHFICVHVAVGRTKSPYESSFLFDFSLL